MSRNINICNVKMLSIFFTENLTQLPNCREVLDSLDKWKMNLQTHYALPALTKLKVRDLMLSNFHNAQDKLCHATSIFAT